MLVGGISLVTQLITVSELIDLLTVIERAQMFSRITGERESI